MENALPGPHGGRSMTERRLQGEREQLKLALTEATMQLRAFGISRAARCAPSKKSTSAAPTNSRHRNCHERRFTAMSLSASIAADAASIAAGSLSS
jgi:hypothetical protein